MILKNVEYKNIPNKSETVYFFKCCRDYLFPNYFNCIRDVDALLERSKELFIEVVSNDENKKNIFFDKLLKTKKDLIEDIKYTYDCDPAAHSYEEVLITYPGMNAIITYRIAHILYELDEKISARIIAEYAHSKTGIDINPGASIGVPFFIDHGTGIVIGETCVIGHHVRIYQGVTLGARSLVDGHNLQGLKRHPTVGNNVIIYANASIIGGDTIVGDNVTVGGNVFINKSIPSNVTVLNKEPELILKENKSNNK